MRSQKKGHGNYALVLTDLEKRIVIDVLEDRKKKTLQEWLAEPPDGVDISDLSHVATDLWQHYRDVVQASFPNVAIVADRFHVVQNLHEAIHKLRRKCQREAKGAQEKKTLKGLRYLLLKNKHNLTETDHQRLAQLEKEQPDLHRVWSLRQELYEWYEQTDVDFADAKTTLDKWIQDAQDLHMPELDVFCKTLINWQPEILNFFQHRITSGFVEGMNSKIRVLKRVTFGLPNFKNFRLRVIGFCG